MLFLPGGARPLVLAWLAFHLWTQETSLDTPEGELCRSWTSGLERSAGAFQCPQGPDGADAKFCCGTCSAPYCCSSELARLDPTQCAAGQQVKWVSDTPQATPTLAPDVELLGLFEILLSALVALLTSIAIGCGCSCVVRYARRRFRCWGQSQNQDPPSPSVRNDLPSYEEACVIYSEDPPSYSDEDPYVSHALAAAQTLATPRGNPQVELVNLSDSSPSLASDDPPPYSVLFPHGPPVLPPTSDVTQLDHANASIQDNEAPPSPSGPSDPALAMGDLSPSQACDSSPVPSPSDAVEFCGARPQTAASAGRGHQGCDDAVESCGASASVGHSPPSSSEEESCGSRPQASASVGCGSPSYGDACAFNCDDPLPYIDEDQCDSVTLAAAWTLATLRDSSEALSASQGNPGVQLVHLNDASLASEDPPPNSVAISHEPQCVPLAFDSPPVEQFQCGALEDEVITVLTTPALLGAAPASPILGCPSEPTMKADELELTQIGSSQ